MKYYGFGPAMAHVTWVKVYENGVNTCSFNKRNNRWINDNGEERTNQSMRDFIISACLNNCLIYRTMNTIELWYHPKL